MYKIKKSLHRLKRKHGTEHTMKTQSTLCIVALQALRTVSYVQKV